MGAARSLRFAHPAFVVQPPARRVEFGPLASDLHRVVPHLGVTVMPRHRVRQDDQSAPLPGLGSIPTFLIMAGMAGILLYVFVTFGMLVAMVPMVIMAVLLKKLFGGGGDGPGGFGGGSGDGGGGA